ncbi:MAG: phage baseplate assembly protein V [Plesiomonas sp.]|uniref:phage baseplate assembly protein V n=1 Tax=Plesiomonas sp. TaxID=2486279 RepID=UPI003F39FCD3
MWNEVNRRISQSLSRIRLAFRIVIGSTDSADRVQTIQGKGIGNEPLRGNELFQHYGFTSCPLPGTMGIVLPLGGVSTHGIVIATEHGAYRLKELKPGEVALYTDEGAKIILKRGRVIDVDCDVFSMKCKQFNVDAEQSAQFTTPHLNTSEAFTSEGKISGNGGIGVKGGDGAIFEGNIEQIGGSFNTDGDLRTPTVSVNAHQHEKGHNGQPTGDPIPR